MENDLHKKMADEFLAKFSSKRDAVIAADEIIELLMEIKTEVPNERAIDGFGWKWAAIIEELAK